MDIQKFIKQYEEVHSQARKIWTNMMASDEEREIGFEYLSYSYRGQIHICESGVILKLHAIFVTEEKDYLIPWVQFWAWNI